MSLLKRDLWLSVLMQKLSRGRGHGRGHERGHGQDAHRTVYTQGRSYHGRNRGALEGEGRWGETASGVRGGTFDARCCRYEDYKS